MNTIHERQYRIYVKHISRSGNLKEDEVNFIVHLNLNRLVKL